MRWKDFLKPDMRDIDVRLFYSSIPSEKSIYIFLLKSDQRKVGLEISGNKFL